MLENRLIGGENFKIRTIGIREINAVATLLEFDIDRLHRDFFGNRIRHKPKFPAIKENPPDDHLIAKIRVEKASLKALDDFVQAGRILSPTPKTSIQIA